MTCKIYPTGSLKSYKYVVVLSEYQGKILLSRHKRRKTWGKRREDISKPESSPWMPPNASYSKSPAR